MYFLTMSLFSPRMRKLIFASGLKMKIPNELDDIEHIVAVNDSLIERIVCNRLH